MNKINKTKFVVVFLITIIILFIPFFVSSEESGEQTPSIILNENSEGINDNGNYQLKIYSDKRFHFEESKWNTLNDLVSLNEDSNNLVLQYKHKTLNLKSFILIGDTKIYIEDLSDDLKTQISFKNNVETNRDYYKFSSEFNNINVTYVGYDIVNDGFNIRYEDIIVDENTVERRIILDDLIEISFYDLIENGYNVTIDNNEIKITNLREGYNLLDPIVNYYTPSGEKDGHISRQETSPYVRTAINSSTTATIGDNHITSPALKTNAAFSFNTSVIPDNAIINSANLNLYADNFYKSSSFSVIWEVYYYIDSNFIGDYVDESDWSFGNYTGSLELEGFPDWIPYSIPSTHFNYINKSGYTDFNLRPEWCSVGSGNEARVSFRSVEYSGTNYDPYLTINYTLPANETSGREAIEEAINSIIPNSEIYTDQQIYISYLDGSQKTGRFDKVAVLGNQTWAFNYITENENYTNMSSLYNIVNVWETQDLLYEDIVEQVNDFINQTLI